MDFHGGMRFGLWRDGGLPAGCHSVPRAIHLRDCTLPTTTPPHGGHTKRAAKALDELAFRLVHSGSMLRRDADDGGVMVVHSAGAVRRLNNVFPTIPLLLTYGRVRFLRTFRNATAPLQVPVDKRRHPSRDATLPRCVLGLPLNFQPQLFAYSCAPFYTVTRITYNVYAYTYFARL